MSRRSTKEYHSLDSAKTNFIAQKKILCTIVYKQGILE